MCYDDWANLVITAMRTFRDVVKLRKALTSAADVLYVYLENTYCFRGSGDAACHITLLALVLLTQGASTFNLFNNHSPLSPFIFDYRPAKHVSLFLPLSPYLSLCLRNFSNPKGHKNEA